VDLSDHSRNGRPHPKPQATLSLAPTVFKSIACQSAPAHEDVDVCHAPECHRFAADDQRRRLIAPIAGGIELERCSPRAAAGPSRKRLDKCLDDRYVEAVQFHGSVSQDRASVEGRTMGTEVAERIEHTLRPDELRRDLSLSRERMARLVDVSAKTVERWEQQHSLPAGTSSRIRTQIAQIQEVRDLGLCVYTPEGLRQFLKTPSPTFDGRTPLQMIEQGKADAVISALASDYEGLGY
jgi:DNA-binding transcriptional regulator YiaG